MNPVDNIEEGTAVTQMRLKEISRPRQTFYYRRLPDPFKKQADPFAPIVDEVEKKDDFFACEEEEASKLDPRKFEQIGVSDGSVFYNTMKASGLFGKWVDASEAKRIYHEAELADMEASRGKFKRPQSKSVYTLGNNVPQDAISGLK